MRLVKTAGFQKLGIQRLGLKFLRDDG